MVAPVMLGGPLSPEQDHYQRMLNFEVGQTKRINLARQQRYMRNRHYFYGENEDADNVKQPLGIRYVPTVNQKHTHYLFGEWDKDVIDWSVIAWANPEGSDKEKATKIQRAIYHLMRRADLNRIAPLGGLDGSVYGDTVFRVGYKANIGGAGIDSVLPEYYHAIWHPLDIGQTLEACVAYNTDRLTAQSMFGSPGNRQYFPPHTALNTGLAIVWEYWNAFEFVQAVDDQVVFRGRNIYAQQDPADPERVSPGHLPFVHIPNLGVNGEYYGFGDAEQTFKLADELNYRMADIGDVINYHAHPITIIKAFYGDVSVLPVSPDAVWDLGREGEASYLEWGGPPPEVMDYISVLLRMLMETSSLTPIAFGKIEASQASSAALNIQMLPVTEVVRRKRAIWSRQLVELAKKILVLEALILEQQRPGLFQERYGFAIADLPNFEITPKWAPILPKDQLQKVGENVGLLSNHARSIKEALRDMGHDDPDSERELILKDVEAILRIEAEMQKMLTEHEAKMNKQLASHEAGLNADQVGLEMKQSAQEHRHKMEEDPTTDPERHARQLELIKTQHQEERQTTATKAKHTVTVERVKQATLKARSNATGRGGKNSDRHKGGSNQSGG